MKYIKNIKNILATIIFSVIILISISTQSLANNKSKIIVETANLRQEASADSKILELISLGETVEIIEQSGEWYKVKYKSIQGYLRNDLLDTSNYVKEPQNNTTEENVQKEQTTQTVAKPENEENNEQVVEENVEAQTEQQENAIENIVEEKKLGTYKTKENIKVKIIPLIQAREVSEVNQNENIQVIDIKNNWAHVQSNNVQGWIVLEKLEYLENTIAAPEQEENKQEEANNENTNTEIKQEESKQNEEQVNTQTEETKKIKYVSAASVNLRQKASTSSDVLKSLKVNTQVTVLEEANGWSKVEVDGKQGYISSQLLSDKKQETSRAAETARKPVENEEKVEEKATNASNETKKEETTNIAATNKGSEVVAYAKKYLGSKYVYGGTSPKGFDCSGFTQYVYKHFGVSLNRTAAAQYSNGKSVSELQTGDLVMFGKSGINHVGIYISGGQFIHAANPSRGVVTDTLLSGYYKTNYVGARRIF